MLLEFERVCYLFAVGALDHCFRALSEVLLRIFQRDESVPTLQRTVVRPAQAVLDVVLVFSERDDAAAERAVFSTAADVQGIAVLV